MVQCLSHQPHDPALAPSVDPSISLIPPVNASGSYYDGMNLSFYTCLSLVGDHFIRFFPHRSGVHPHGPEYSGKSNRTLTRTFILTTGLQIHFTGQFLPWHRWYLYVFEQSLKYRCGYNGVSPYWNWSIGSHLFFCFAFQFLMAA